MISILKKLQKTGWIVLVLAMVFVLVFPATAQSPVPDVLGWGYNAEGQASVPSDFTNDTAIATGWFHNLALKSDGSVWTWGMNAYGQLGNGSADFDPHPMPAQVPGISSIVSVAGGSYHSMAIRADQTVWVWGNNNQGQLGDGTTTKSNSPKQVLGIGPARAAGGGWGHSLVVLTDGTVWAWGLNDKGQSGLETAGAAAAAAAAIQIGQNNPQLPPSLSGDIQFDSLLGGPGSATGRYYEDFVPFYTPTPILVPGLSSINAVAGGYYHSLALRNDGTVWTWGDNQCGQLGLGIADNNPHPTPTMVADLNGVVAISAGYWHSLALKSDGTIWAWGCNNESQLGNGTTSSVYYPVQVTVVTGTVRSISAGAYHNLAVLSNGSLVAWGLNNNSQADPPQGLHTASKVAAGFAHSLVLLSSRPAWDVNGDHIVNVLDLTAVGSKWGQSGPVGWIPEDAQPDGMINVLDLTLIGAHWLETW